MKMFHFLLFTLTGSSWIPFVVLSQDIVLQSERVTNFGQWGTFELCPSSTHATFVYGMRLKIHPDQGFWGDDTALNAIELFCITPGGKRNVSADVNPSQGFTTITSSVGTKGSWGSIAECPEGEFAVGFQLRSEEYLGPFSDDTAGNNLRLFCSPNTTIAVSGQNGGWWTAERRCPRDMRLCGIKTQVERSDVDHTSLNNVDIGCCAVPIPTTTTAEPTTEDTTVAQPDTTKPNTEESTVAPPDTTEPTTEETTVAPPDTTKPNTEETTVAPPDTTEPTTEETTVPPPTTPELTTEDPSTEEPTTAEQATTEQTTEEPTAETSTSITTTSSGTVVTSISTPTPPNETTVPPSDDFACPKPLGNFRDPKNCAAFYSCFANSIIGRQVCPTGLHYDESVDMCNYSWKVDCDVKH